MNLKLNPIILDKEYASNWNESCKDFVLLCDGEKPLRETLYRTGMFRPNLTEYLKSLIQMVQSK
jgi:hypothetical protein